MHAMYPQILSTYSMCVACVYLDLCALKTMAQALQSVVLSILKGGGGSKLEGYCFGDNPACYDKVLLLERVSLYQLQLS